MKAGELLSKKYRYKLNAATMLGQGKMLIKPKLTLPAKQLIFSALMPILHLKFMVNNRFPTIRQLTEWSTAR